MELKTRALTVTGGAGAKPRTHPHTVSSITAPAWINTGRSRTLRHLVARRLDGAAVVASAVGYPRHGGLCFRSSFREHHEHSERLRDDHDVAADLARALGLPADLVEGGRVRPEKLHRRRQSPVDIVHLQRNLLLTNRVLLAEAKVVLY